MENFHLLLGGRLYIQSVMEFYFHLCWGELTVESIQNVVKNNKGIAIEYVLRLETKKTRSLRGHSRKRLGFRMVNFLRFLLPSIS